jgi:hypothetical protein
MRGAAPDNRQPLRQRLDYRLKVRSFNDQTAGNRCFARNTAGGWLQVAAQPRRGSQLPASHVQFVFHDAAVASLTVPLEHEYIALRAGPQGHYGPDGIVIFTIECDVSNPYVGRNVRGIGGPYDDRSHALPFEHGT